MTTFTQLAVQILSENLDKPMTAEEVWLYATDKKYDLQLGSSGTNPKKIMSSALYMSVKNGNTFGIVSSGENPKVFSIRKNENVEIDRLEVSDSKIENKANIEETTNDFKTIDISLKTWNKLKKYARVFEDDENDVILRALEALDEKEISEKRKAKLKDTYVFKCDKNDIDVTHTSLTEVKIDNIKIKEKDWGAVLKKVTNLVKNKKKGDGIEYLKQKANSYFIQKTNSIKPISSKKCLEFLIDFANYIEIGIEIKFKWHNKKEALIPDGKGILYIGTITQK